MSDVKSERVDAMNEWKLVQIEMKWVPKIKEMGSDGDELKKMVSVRSGIWTHALFRRPELESGALDHSAILTFLFKVMLLIYISKVVGLIFTKIASQCLYIIPFLRPIISVNFDFFKSFFSTLTINIWVLAIQ